MFKVRSLKITIILQFAVMIAPIASVLVYQAANDAKHASSVKFALQSVMYARQARDNYKVFLNGVADAVDTGTLSDKARHALEDTKASLLALQSWDPSFRIEAFQGPLNVLLDATRGNPTLKDLLPLRADASRVSSVLASIAETYDARQSQNAEIVAQEVRQQVWIALTVMCVTLASAVGFVVSLIRGLTEPLNRAVTLAENIAEGDFREEKSIDTRRDIGGLLASLASMRDRLRKAFRELAANELRLGNAQRLAGIGDWELDLVGGALTRSEEVYRIFGRNSGEFPVTSAVPPEVVQ